MLVRVVKQFDWHDARMTPFVAVPGELIDVLNRDDLDRLMRQGYITSRWNSMDDPFGMKVGKSAAEFARTKRIGIFLFTSPNYSGGRIHMYQYALCLAQNGCEVFLITNRQPKWRKDYPDCPRLQILIAGKDAVPNDLDLIVTDSKQDFGVKAFHYKHEHPGVPFICMNFESPNWVATLCPDYAKRLNVTPDLFRSADFLLANSNLSAKFLLEWLGTEQPCAVVPPAVNTAAISGSPHGELLRGQRRPYAVWSARSPSYKGGKVAVDAIWELDIPFDLIVFGKMNNQPPKSTIHKLIRKEDHSDEEKFSLMLNAHMVLAPSKFEGYGMVPGEALAVGTPCHVYDLPVLREEYGDLDGLIYTKWGDEAAYKSVVRKAAITEKPKLDPKPIRKKYGLRAMSERLETIPYHGFKKPRVSVQLLTYWGFVPESLESIYDSVDEIFVAHGRVPHAQEMDDGSLERLKAFPDPDNKIKMKVQDYWKGGKLEMRTWCSQQASGNFMLLLDGDEIWTGLDDWIKADIPFGCPRWLNFWHTEDHWIHDTAKLAGTRWGRKLDPEGSICPHYRWSWWRQSYYFLRHPWPCDREKKTLHVRDGAAAERFPQTIIYHLGHMLSPQVMQKKHEFYLDRDGRDAGRVTRMQAWHNWDGKIGDCGDGIIAPVEWELPDIVKRGAESVKNMELVGA